MARLREEYNNRIKAELMKEGDFKNVMEVPTLKKIVINVGAGEAITNKIALEENAKILELISGQKPVINKAKKAVSAFKLREGLVS